MGVDDAPLFKFRIVHASGVSCGEVYATSPDHAVADAMAGRWHYRTAGVRFWRVPGVLEPGLRVEQIGERAKGA